MYKHQVPNKNKNVSQLNLAILLLLSSSVDEGPAEGTLCYFHTSVHTCKPQHVLQHLKSLLSRSSLSFKATLLFYLPPVDVFA